MAIYIDDHQGAVTVSGNIFYRVPFAFFSNQGADFSISNNLFVESQVNGLRLASQLASACCPRTTSPGLSLASLSARVIGH